MLTSGDERGVRWRAGERLEQLFEQRCDQALALDGRSLVAVDGPTGTLTYAELDARANQLARFLSLRHGVAPGDRVGLLFDYGVDGYVAMLAVLKLHAAYVPLDVGFPPDRLAYICTDAGVRTVLTQSHLAASLAAIDDGVSLLCLDAVDAQIAGERDERLGADELSGPVDDLCYVIYTSGTTGQPKGVAISHASIVNFVRVASEVYGVEATDRVYQGLTIAFDFSIEEIWVAWMAGAALVPKPRGGPLLGLELHDYLEKHRVTALCCVPTLLATIEDDLPQLRFLLVSGEACPQDLVDRWHRPGRRFLNVYGPTETTVSATWTVLEPSRPVTIGVPLPTYSAVVLDPDTDRALPAGAMGELGIAGIGVSGGYLNRPEATRASFIEDFISMPDNPSGAIYRTGDLVRVNDSGELEHHGRIDTQVKVRGYRIELEEIEAVLRRAPGVAQAVVDARDSGSGVRELAAYYTADRELDGERVYQHLRDQLPAYMIPAYLERIERVPMMPSGKVDRRSLPEPRGRRRVGSAGDYVAPETEVEAVLAGALAAVLGVDRVSASSHFFEHLGANSLLMAQFAARLRRDGVDLPPVSIKDIYLHPTVRELAGAIQAHEAGPDAVPEWREPELPPATGTPRYLLCGALQLVSLVLCAALVGIVLDAGSSWVFSSHDAAEVYLRSVAVGALLLASVGALPIAAKWVLIGRLRPQPIRVWSLAYFRFWAAKTLLVFNPLPHLIVNSPLYPLYLRALGARIGRRVLIRTHHVPVCADLIEIGDDVVIGKDAFLNGYRGRAGAIEFGAVTLGSGAFVGEQTVLDINTELGAGATLGHSSCLHSGQRVPAGESWHGSPARPAPADYDYRPVAAAEIAPARAFRYGLVRVLALLALFGPLQAGLGAVLLTHQGAVDRLPVLALPAIAAAMLVGLLGVSLIVAVALPRLLNGALKPGKVYPLYGLHYGIQRAIAAGSNNPLLTGLFGDSSAIVHYLRLIGYRLGAIEQTGSNFGMQVKHDVPGLNYVGTGTMVSDGLSLVNAEFSSTSFRVLPAEVGKRSYIGNAVRFPARARTGEDCLFATKAMVPIGGPVRSGVGLLGSPCFEIPRSVDRDRQFEAISSGAERRRRLAAKTRHNAVTMVLHLLVTYVTFLGMLAIATGPFGGSGLSDLPGTIASTFLELVLILAVFVIAERAVTGFRPMAPNYCSIYDPQFWSHERYWKVAPTAYQRIFDGTPFKSILWRLVGVNVGRRMFDDGAAITERTLVAIGDEAMLNMGSNLQAHTLEDGVFKSDRITIGNRCSVGTGAFVNYGAVMEDGASLDPDTFLMKGSRAQAGSRWRGNPGMEIWSGEGKTTSSGR